MSDIKAALVAVEDEIPAAVQASVSVNAVDEDTLELTKPRRVKPKPGQIGEGKGVPLSKSQRKRALYVIRIVLMWPHRVEGAHVATVPGSSSGRAFP